MEKPDVAAMDVEELRRLAAALLVAVDQKDKEIHWKDLKISQLSHEMAILKRWRFGRTAEALTGLQKSLLEESIDEDLGAIELEVSELADPPKPRKHPVRAHLPVDLPRVEHRHEPDSTRCECGCQMKRIGEDVADVIFRRKGAGIFRRIEASGAGILVGSSLSVLRSVGNGL